LRHILPPAGCVKTTTKTQGGALRWINDYFRQKGTEPLSG
jgi:hypothetical protein